MSRHWKSQRTEWLSPEAYDVLSPDERRRLWGERKAQRRRIGGGGFRRDSTITLMLASVFAGLIGAGAWHTFYVNGDKVRIAGIDAPETHPPRCDDEARLGDEATEKLHSLLNSGAVTLSPLGTSIDRDRDTYGRLLRNVAVNGQDVGEAMISARLARDYGSGRKPWC